MRKATDKRDAETISLLWTSLLLFHGGDVTCFDACHVIWCGGHVIWCDVIACVVSCHVMQCDVICDVPCNGHVVCCSKWFCDMWWSKVLFCTTKYYCVLQSTTPVLLCTTKYYSSTSTTTYYSSTTLYCKVLLQYYSVLQSTTPVLLCTTKHYSSTTPVLHSTTTYYSSTTLYYKVLLYSTTLYCKVLLQYYSVLHSTTTYYSVLKYYSSTTLYYKAAFMIDPWHIWTVIYMIDVRRIWNVIYNARSNRSHNPTSPNTAPATQNESHDWSASDMKRHLQCAEQQESQSNFTKYCACHAKWISWLIRIRYETSFTMRGATRHPPTSPNTAPATQNESHDWSASHMKRHLQCAEQAKSPSNLTK